MAIAQPRRVDEVHQRNSPPLTGFLQRAVIAYPEFWVKSHRHRAVKTRKWPVRWLLHQAVFDRVEMDVIHVSGIVFFIPDRVFPIAALPNAAFAAAQLDGRAILLGWQ